MSEIIHFVRNYFQIYFSPREKITILLYPISEKIIRYNQTNIVH